MTIRNATLTLSTLGGMWYPIKGYWGTTGASTGIPLGVPQRYCMRYYWGTTGVTIGVPQELPVLLEYHCGTTGTSRVHPYFRCLFCVSSPRNDSGNYLFSIIFNSFFWTTNTFLRLYFTPPGKSPGPVPLRFRKVFEAQKKLLKIIEKRWSPPCWRRACK